MKKNTKRIIAYVILVAYHLLIVPLGIWGICKGVGVEFHWKYCLIVYSIYLLSRSYPLNLTYEKND
mgnify:CR=1 FL=1